MLPTDYPAFSFLPSVPLHPFLLPHPFLLHHPFLHPSLHLSHTTMEVDADGYVIPPPSRFDPIAAHTFSTTSSDDETTTLNSSLPALRTLRKSQPGRRSSSGSRRGSLSFKIAPQATVSPPPSNEELWKATEVLRSPSANPSWPSSPLAHSPARSPTRSPSSPSSPPSSLAQTKSQAQPTPTSDFAALFDQAFGQSPTPPPPSAVHDDPAAAEGDEECASDEWSSFSDDEETDMKTLLMENAMLRKSLRKTQAELEEYKAKTQALFHMQEKRAQKLRTLCLSLSSGEISLPPSHQDKEPTAVSSHTPSSPPSEAGESATVVAGDDTATVRALLQSTHHANTLSITDTRLDHWALQPIESFLVNSPRLSQIDISRCGLNDRSLAVLASALSASPPSSLTSLSLSCNALQGTRLLLLAQSLVALPHFTTLDLSDNKLTDSSIVGASFLIAASSSLTDLDLARNAFSDPSASVLAKALRFSVAISYLNLRGNSFSRSSIRTITHAWLDIHPSNLSPHPLVFSAHPPSTHV